MAREATSPETAEQRHARLYARSVDRWQRLVSEMESQRLHGRIILEAIVIDGRLTFIETTRKDGEK